MADASAAAAPADAHTPEARLVHFPISFFAITMGLSGVTLATQGLEKTAGMTHVLSLAALAIAAASGVVVSLFYAAKWLRYPQAVRAEWNHPVRLVFFPAVTISLILLGTAALPFAGGIAFLLWALGSGLHLIATLAVVSSWIGHRPFEPPHLNPAWFIPAVGNILVPIAGVPLGYGEISWFFFSVGIVFWVILLTLVFNRLVFHNPLPERLLPTLVILIAPPAAGFISYCNLNGLDAFARILFYAATLFALLVLTQLPKLARIAFSVSWWAYSFPIAAFAVATFLYAERAHSDAHRFAAYGVYAVLMAVIAILCLRTIRAILAGQVCKPE